MKSDTVVSVLGLGLLGASFCMELEGKYRRAGWSRNPENRKKALAKGCVEFTVDTPAQASPPRICPASSKKAIPA